MKTLILIFMHFYCLNDGKKAAPDYRNYAHGFFGSIIWAIGFFATAHYFNYQNYVVIAIINGILLAVIFGIAWELFQRRILFEYKFNWMDVLAGNIWFIPLWFFFNLLRMLSPNSYLAAERDFINS